MKFKLKIIYYWFKLMLAPKLTSREAIASFQEKKLQNFVKNTLTKSKFYAKFFVGRKLDWASVPVISKTEFMEHFDDINTQGILKKDAFQIAFEAENSRNFKSEI